MGKVRFGISDVYYCKLTETTVSGAPSYSYAAKVALPGAVSLTLDVQGDTNNFYADNGVYASFDARNGFDGTLTLADIPESVYTDLLGYYKDSNNLLTEIAAANEAYFGLMCKVSSNDDPIGFKFWKCTFSNPSISANTTTESIDPDTQELPIHIMPMKLASGASVIKSHQVLESASAETTFFGGMTAPTVTVS